MPEAQVHRVRLRFRVLKKLSIDAIEHPIHVGGRPVVLSSPLPDLKISDSEWLVINSRDFNSEQDARDFGERIHAAIQVASVATRLGVDVGRDLATSGLGKAVKEKIQESTGAIVRDNVHGLDVFADDPNVRFITINAQGTVRAGADRFLGELCALHDVAAKASKRSREIVLLLNAALMQPHPVAQIVFAFSAVKMLGQEEAWTNEQRLLLAQLAEQAEASTHGTPNQNAEVAEAIRKCHRLTLRQGVLRLLDSLGIGHLRGQWDKLYAERSTLVHGLAPQPGADYGDFSHRSINLCGRILLTALADEIPQVSRYVDTLYPE